MKPLLAAALALLLTTGLAACGDEGPDDSTAASTAATTQEPTPAAPPEGEGSAGGEEPRAGRGASSDPSQEEGSAGFRTPGGDNSIQNYGEEAGDREREAASPVVLGFLEAQEKDDWSAACGYLSDSLLKQLEALAVRLPQLKGKKCPQILEALIGRTPASTRANRLDGSIDSLRFEGDRGFALYHGTDGKDYFLSLVKEDGEWKAGSLAPSELPG